MESTNAFGSPVDWATLGVLLFVLALQLVSGLISFFQKCEPGIDFAEANDHEFHKIGIINVRGSFPSLYWLIYSAPEYSPNFHLIRPIWRVFCMSEGEAGVFRLLLRQMSLLALAVIGIIRFTSGEPILNLF